VELNFKCSCGAAHEVRLYDECRYCAKPISKIDWIKANLTSADVRAIIEWNTRTITEPEHHGEKETKAETASGVVVEKRTSKRLRESVVD
jgi:hypothetical protein